MFMPVRLVVFTYLFVFIILSDALIYIHISIILYSSSVFKYKSTIIFGNTLLIAFMFNAL